MTEATAVGTTVTTRYYRIKIGAALAYPYQVDEDDTDSGEVFTDGAEATLIDGGIEAQGGQSYVIEARQNDADGASITLNSVKIQLLSNIT